ncbi:FluG domain-containing protein [Beauveria bassiana ARSEF 2860]|uniref:FluG domain-containing protein n=1 Tax=Beauveria bassiana (strain ARSEF 2860) TaxID=655819 RepID=J4VSY4_BEAB2|nr:FluG domain-containing protein [Beauveria bassiana ARSEF 2860]EJP61685.1 FluG domain-containing protein [Beauveria bassiana ARSEF 2860]
MPSAVARTHHANAPDSHHLDFLQFQRAKQLERAPKPTPLSAEQHAANRECLSTVRFVKPKYSAETEINVSGIFGRWKRYCSEKEVGDWRATIVNLTRATTMDFFLFVCGNYNVRSWGRYMDRNDAKEVYKYHRNVLIPRFNLRAPNIDGKPVLNVDSLRVILTFNIAYDTSVFSLGRHRIQLAGCYQLLCYTGARPAELVDGERKGPKDGSREILFGQKVIQQVENDGSADQTLDKQSVELNKMLLQETIKRGRPKALCYEDILLMLVRHPTTGKPVLAMAIKFIHHKGADNKPKPTIFFFTPTRKLIFDAIMVIVALALHDHAFDAACLTDAYSLLSRDVWGPRDCDATDSVRDQMMRHEPGFKTFFSAYLNEIANFDLQNAFLEEEKQSQLFRMFAHVSLTRDPRAVRDMVPEKVWANQLPDPEIVKWEEERAVLKQGRYRVAGSEHEDRIRVLTDDIRNKRTQNERRVVKEYREYYFYNRPTWDIEAQARGEMEEEYEQPAMDLVIPERARLANIMCLQADDWTETELFQRRVEAIDLMVALCDKKETGRTSRTQRPATVEAFIKQQSPGSVTLSEPDLEPDPFPLLMEATQCPDCIGDEQLSVEARKFKWCRPPVLNDHFDDAHLARRETAAQCGEAIWCGHPKCRQEKFVHVDHFRNHVEQVHGVSLRTSHQVAKRRKRQTERREKKCRGRQQKKTAAKAAAKT